MENTSCADNLKIEIDILYIDVSDAIGWSPHARGRPLD
jgi:hypothetical protein